MFLIIMCSYWGCSFKFRACTHTTIICCTGSTSITSLCYLMYIRIRRIHSAFWTSYMCITCNYERTCTTCCRTTSTTRTTSWASTWTFTSTYSTISAVRAYGIMISAVVAPLTFRIGITFRTLRGITRDCRTASITFTVMCCCAVSCARATWWTFWITATCWTIWVVCTYLVCTVTTFTIILCHPLCI